MCSDRCSRCLGCPVMKRLVPLFVAFASLHLGSADLVATAAEPPPVSPAKTDTITVDTAVAGIEALGGRVDRDPFDRTVTKVVFIKLTDDQLGRAIPLLKAADPVKLELDSKELTTAALVHLRSFTSIRELKIGHLKPSATDLEFVESLVALEEFKLVESGSLTDDSLKHFRSLKRLKRLDLDYSKVTDAGLSVLVGLPELEVVSIQKTAITGEGFRHLPKATGLATVFASGSRFDDRGLKNVSRASKLEVLYLSATPITDAGLAELRGATKIHRLALTDTTVSDQGLQVITGFKTLEWIDLEGTKVTDVGVARFQKALPKCKVLWK
jgi:hypothetical protein